MSENGATKKATKNLPPESLQKDRFGVQMDDFFVAETFPKSLKFPNSQKITPGASRGPKGIQKATKRHPKGIQKVSKRRPNLYKLYTTGMKILKSQCKELQRTLHPIRASQLQQNHKAFSMSTFHAGVQV